MVSAKEVAGCLFWVVVGLIAFGIAVGAGVTHLIK